MKKAILLTGLFLLAIVNLNTVTAQGCVEASSDEGPQLVGYIQPQFNAYFFGSKDNGDAIKPSTFLFKRARIGVVGSIPYDISYYVMAEFAPEAGGPQLLDAFVTYAPLGKYAKFSLGQFKAPFTLELSTPCHALHTIRRSTAVNNLASPFRELGFMVLGAVGKERDVFTYRIAILNGTGINHLDDNNNKDIAGRLTVLPLEWLEIGGSFRTGFYGIQTKDSTGAWVQKKRTRTAVDLTIEKSNFMLQGEYIFGKDVGDISSGGGCGGKSTDGALPVYDKSGFWVAVMYMTPWQLQPIVKYETYNPDGTTYSYLGSAQAIEQNTLTIGLNYFLNDWTRVQVNYLYNSEGKKADGSVGEYKNDAFMIQVQAKF